MAPASPEKRGILGFGLAGMLTYLELIKGGVNPSNILIFDPDFIGGDLARSYSSIESNTLWKSVVDIFPEAESLFPELDKDKTTNILYLPKVLETLCSKTLHLSELCPIPVTSLTYTNNKWAIEANETYSVDIVYLCQGGQPKSQNIPGKWIPLSIALDKDLLKRYVNPLNTYTVFGLSHSGTLVLKNLLDLDVQVNAIYKTPTPFEYSRDGFYSGIKQESETIADSILRGDYPKLKLISATDINSVARAIKKTSTFISATGFEPRKIKILVEGSSKNSLNYSTDSALIDECPNCYGFGMAYPSFSVINGKKHNDISFSAFYRQISRIISQSFNNDN
jgi:hypothetical protein